MAVAGSSFVDVSSFEFAQLFFHPRAPLDLYFFLPFIYPFLLLSLLLPYLISRSDSDEYNCEK